MALGLELTPSSYGLFKKLRYQDVGPVPFFRKVLDARAVARQRLGPALGAVAAPVLAAGLRLLAPEKTRSSTGLEVRTITSFSKDYDRLWERCRGSYTMCARRDATYLE